MTEFGLGRIDAGVLLNSVIYTVFVAYNDRVDFVNVKFATERMNESGNILPGSRRPR